jgi:uncharacterized membrane protein (Fun14 family)
MIMRAFTYTMTDFDGGATTLMANPNAAGLNTTANVLQMIKNAGQVWGGSKLTLASPLDFTTNNTFKMMVHSPRTGCPVLFKIEGAAGVYVERTAYTTVANQWEELSWDFTGTASNTYTDLVFIYDLNVMGDGSANFTFYQDEIQFTYVAATLNQIDLPVTFDVATTDYTVTDFGGNGTSLGTDPMNASNTVAITLKGAAAQTWAGTTISTPLGFANAIPFTATNHKMTMRVYSPDAGIPVRLKAEVVGQATQSVETEAMTTVANAWETLTFDFDNQAAGTAPFNSAYAYNMASVFFNFGTDGATAGAKTYHWDDVMMYTPSTPNQIDLPVTFDVANTDYTMTDFGGTATMVAADPMNASNMVGMTVKGATAQFWAGTTMGTNNVGFANVIPFTAGNHKMTARVYSPVVGASIKLKVEVTGQSTQSVETDQLTTVANGWETLTFDFDVQSSGTAAFNTAFPYDMATIFFNFGATGTTETYYFDDVMMYTPSTPNQIDLPVTFDVANTDYTMTDFGGTATMVAADPMNASNMVGMTVKGATAQFWAGTTMGTNNVGFANVIPFTTANHKMTARVYSPVVGASIKLKVEVTGQSTQSVETDQLTTVANAWETLTFDFDVQSSGTAAFNTAFPYDMASIFFNFGNTGTTETYYFDDVMMYTPSTPNQIDLPVTFDVANTDYTMTDFGGTATMVAADPMNASNMVGMTVKGATAQFWAGTTMGTNNVGFANVIPFTTANHKMTARVYSPVVGASIKLKVEVTGQSTQSVETDQLTTVANAWETLTFDFDAQSAGTAAFNTAFPYDMASIFFNFGNTGTTETYYFDDVMMYTPSTPNQIDLPVTFDVANTDYTMTDFGGTATMVAADPMNASNMVGMTVKGATAQFWAGTTMGTNNVGFANVIPFTTANHKMTARVYSPVVGASIKLKVEVTGQSTQSVETDQLTTVANAWETLTFDFDVQSAGTAAFNTAFPYDMATIFFNFGNTGTTETYYFDDVMMYTPSTPNQIDLPVTFDVANTDYTMTDFGGTATMVAADPMNASNMVGMTVKGATAQFWAGTTMGTNNVGFANVIPFTTANHKMTARVYSPVVGASIKLKVEVTGQSTQSVETDQLTTVANAWETLTFDFDAQSAGTAAFNTAFPYDMASIFFNFGNTGTTETYYFDDVMMATPTGPAQIDLPVTFDLQNVDYTVTDFGGNGTTLGSDPMNASNTVAISLKGAAAQTWAGTTISTPLGFANAIPFTATNRKMTIRVYSPDAGIPVRLKAEVVGQPTQSVETEAMTTVANAWETLTFDFNNQAAGTAPFNTAYAYDMASVFFNFGTDGATAGAKTYLWDDVMMYVPTVSNLPTLPVTYDDPAINYAMVDFDGGATTLMANPFPGGINNTAKVLQMVKNAGQVWGGSKMTLASAVDFSNGATFKMQVYSNRVNCPVLFKLEGPGGVYVEKTAYTTVANAWQDLSWDFTGAASNLYNDLVFIYDLGVMGDGSANFTFYQDSIRLMSNGGSTLDQIDLVVTFDSANVDYTLTDFGGNVTVLGSDPMNASNSVAITTKTSGAQTWAGTTIGTNAGFANVIPFTSTFRKMSVMVYSPDAGIPVRLKAEVHGQPTQSVETEAITTVANAWETLTFDFNNPAAGTAPFNAAYAYDMASIFFNFGTDGATAGAKTYYWDNVMMADSTVGIENPLSSSVKVYPNPVENVLSINLPSNLDNQNLSYSVTDMTGRIVLNGKLAQTQLNVKELNSGIYSLQIQTSNGVINKRFVKR